MARLKFTVPAFFALVAIFTACQKTTTNTAGQPRADSVATETASAPKPLATASHDVLMHPEYAKASARLAYIWGYPMVNMLNRAKVIGSAPKIGLLGGILPVAPTGQLSMLSDYIDPAETFVTCPNQDVVYGLGYFSLDEQPVVLQVPEFGDRFWVYAIYDMRTDQAGELGKPYGSKAGFYLLKGPKWKGEVPAGITGVIQSPTAVANVIPRAFMDDTPEDRAAIQPLLNQIVAYPLTEFDGKMKTIDWKNSPIIPNPNAGKASGETKWVVPEKFFDELGIVLETTEPLPGEEALYSQFRALLAIAAREPEMKKLITAEAVAADKSLVQQLLQWKFNGKPAGNGWNRSQNNAQWGIDYYNRLGTSRSNMFDNRPSETQYFYTDFTADGQKLQGKNNYKITFKELPPVKGFWSLTLYNHQHLFHPNALKRYSLGTKNKSLKKNPDGSLTLYAGKKNPGADKESNWLPAPNDNFSLYIRAYWGEAAITEGTWTPPSIEKY
jgi:hypothetical protein